MCADRCSGGSNASTVPQFAPARIFHIDDSVHTFQVPTTALGIHLYHAVIQKLGILEADYFDLEFVNHEGVRCWLDHSKPLVKQIGFGKDFIFRFSVKFYTPHPNLLEEEHTRYLFALQIKRDLLDGLLICSDNTGALLASYIVQAAIGDFLEEEYLDTNYLRPLKILHKSTEDRLLKVRDFHRTHIGLSPAEADFNLLDTARKVEYYGIRMHLAKDHEGLPLNLAVAHTGVVVFQNLTRINNFSWAKIRKLSFKRKRFLVKLHPEGFTNYYRDPVEFYFDSRDECKRFWKKAIEHHAFFRCQLSDIPIKKRNQMITKGSSYRYMGRTQKQLIEFARDNAMKRPLFERDVSRCRKIHVRPSSWRLASVNSQSRSSLVSKPLTLQHQPLNLTTTSNSSTSHMPGVGAARPGSEWSDTELATTTWTRGTASGAGEIMRGCRSASHSPTHSSSLGQRRKQRRRSSGGRILIDEEEVAPNNQSNHRNTTTVENNYSSDQNMVSGRYPIIPSRQSSATSSELSPPYPAHSSSSGHHQPPAQRAQSVSGPNTPVGRIVCIERYSSSESGPEFQPPLGSTCAGVNVGSGRCRSSPALAQPQYQAPGIAGPDNMAASDVSYQLTRRHVSPVPGNYTQLEGCTGRLFSGTMGAAPPTGLVFQSMAAMAAATSRWRQQPPPQVSGTMGRLGRHDYSNNHRRKKQDEATIEALKSELRLEEPSQMTRGNPSHPPTTPPPSANSSHSPGVAGRRNKAEPPQFVSVNSLPRVNNFSAKDDTTTSPQESLSKIYKDQRKKPKPETTAPINDRDFNPLDNHTRYDHHNNHGSHYHKQQQEMQRSYANNSAGPGNSYGHGYQEKQYAVISGNGRGAGGASHGNNNSNSRGGGGMRDRPVSAGDLDKNMGTVPETSFVMRYHEGQDQDSCSVDSPAGLSPHNPVYIESSGSEPDISSCERHSRPQSISDVEFRIQTPGATRKLFIQSETASYHGRSRDSSSSSSDSRGSHASLDNQLLGVNMEAESPCDAVASPQPTRAERRVVYQRTPQPMQGQLTSRSSGNLYKNHQAINQEERISKQHSPITIAPAIITSTNQQKSRDLRFSNQQQPIMTSSRQMLQQQVVMTNGPPTVGIAATITAKSDVVKVKPIVATKPSKKQLQQRAQSYSNNSPRSPVNDNVGDAGVDSSGKMRRSSSSSEAIRDKQQRWRRQESFDRSTPSVTSAPTPPPVPPPMMISFRPPIIEKKESMEQTVSDPDDWSPAEYDEDAMAKANLCSQPRPSRPFPASNQLGIVDRTNFFADRGVSPVPPPPAHLRRLYSSPSSSSPTSSSTTSPPSSQQSSPTVEQPNNQTTTLATVDGVETNTAKSCDSRTSPTQHNIMATTASLATESVASGGVASDLYETQFESSCGGGDNEASSSSKSSRRRILDFAAEDQESVEESEDQLEDGGPTRSFQETVEGNLCGGEWAEVADVTGHQPMSEVDLEDEYVLSHTSDEEGSDDSSADGSSASEGSEDIEPFPPPPPELLEEEEDKANELANQNTSDTSPSAFGYFNHHDFQPSS